MKSNNKLASSTYSVLYLLYLIFFHLCFRGPKVKRNITNVIKQIFALCHTADTAQRCDAAASMIVSSSWTIQTTSEYFIIWHLRSKRFIWRGVVFFPRISSCLLKVEKISSPYNLRGRSVDRWNNCCYLIIKVIFESFRQ